MKNQIAKVNNILLSHEMMNRIMYKHILLTLFVLLLSQSIRGQNWYDVEWSEEAGYKVTDRNGIEFSPNPMQIEVNTVFRFRVILDPAYSKSNIKVTERTTNMPLEKDDDGIYSHIVTQNSFINVTGVTPDKYTVDFNSLGGSLVSSITDISYGDKITKPDPNPGKHGLSFQGWFTDTLYTDEWRFDSDQVTQDTTLYAKWMARVTFYYQHGAIPNEEMLFLENQLVTEPDVEPREGKIIAGWYTDRQYTNVWDFSSARVTIDTFLYAKWVPENYTVTLPDVDGVSYDTHLQVTVNYGGDFTFHPTVADNYTPITSVEASLGYQVKNNEDGSYTIENITDDISIHIYGVARIYTVSLGFEKQEVSQFVSCTPSPGLYEYTAGSIMQIMLNLDNAYEEYDLRIVANGDTILADEKTKQSLTIAYSFNIHIDSDMNIKIICIDPEIPTGTHQRPKNDEIKVYTIPDHVIIEGTNSSYILQKEKVYIYTMTGQLEQIQSLQEGTTTIPLPKGIYIVVIGKEQRKVIIR